ncbi:MAG: endolytic transglycosylase MltG [Oscillospiraceae bacterium]|nr:endolytic transglycosylase MltG [Oscillospiraceae bacterium]
MAGKKNVKEYLYEGLEQKPKANTGCLRGILYFVCITTASLFLAIFGWNCVNDVLALIKPDKEVQITIAEDFNTRELARELAELGVVNYAWLFSLFCDYTDAEEHIEPGTYTINSRLDYNAIVRSFVIIPVREEVTISIPDARTLLETLTIIAEAGVSDLESLLREADEGEFAFSFLDDVPMQPGRLEGYLFPDTYVFYTTASPRSVLRRILNNFNLKFSDNLRKPLATMDYSLNEILTIASLIQMEAANSSEMKSISAVIHNRLNSNTLRNLEIDATSVYLMGRENIHSAADVREGRLIDSPYNTFLYEGLPPGPICSPGTEAIRAALWPDSTRYYFYALHVDRTHRFFRDSDSFERFIRSSDAASY